MELAALRIEDIDEIARLCRRAIPDPPARDELSAALFGPESPATVFGHPAIGVVATVDGDQGGHIRLLAVDPDQRRKGYGNRLVEMAEASARAKGHRSLTTGADPPLHLWPGVPTADTAMLCLFERRRYTRVDVNFDMRIDLSAIPPDPGGAEVARDDDRDEVATWFEAHWPNWRSEGMRALAKRSLVICRDDSGISAACAFDANRAGVLGPVAVRPDLIGRGRGRPALVRALHEARRRGCEQIDVGWVGPVRPYAEVGGTVGSIYFVYRAELA